MNTRKIIITTFKALAISSAFLFIACENTILNLQPEQAISNSSAVVNKKSAEAALVGAYDKLQSGSYYGSEFVASIYLSGNNVTWTGSLNYYRAFNNHSYQADNTTINSTWFAIYAAVNEANQVIDKVTALQSADLTDTEKNRIVGEAYFCLLYTSDAADE